MKITAEAIPLKIAKSIPADNFDGRLRITSPCYLNAITKKHKRVE